MKNLSFLILMIAASINAVAQDVAATQAITPKGAALTNHLMDNSWMYVSGLFVVLVLVFITAYYFGWDKKLFKHKAGEENNQWFI